MMKDGRLRIVTYNVHKCHRARPARAPGAHRGGAARGGRRRRRVAGGRERGLGLVARGAPGALHRRGAGLRVSPRREPQAPRRRLRQRGADATARLALPQLRHHVALAGAARRAAHRPRGRAAGRAGHPPLQRPPRHGLRRAPPPGAQARAATPSCATRSSKARASSSATSTSGRTGSRRACSRRSCAAPTSASTCARDAPTPARSPSSTSTTSTTTTPSTSNSSHSTAAASRSSPRIICRSSPTSASATPERGRLTRGAHRPRAFDGR